MDVEGERRALRWKLVATLARSLFPHIINRSFQKALLLMKSHHFRILKIPFSFCAAIPLLAQAHEADWNIAALDQILAAVQPGQKLVQVGDMQILVSGLTAWRNQLAGTPSPQSAFDGLAHTWPGGNVYYNFSTSGQNAVPPNLQRAFLDAANEWATFANIHFVPVTTQTNYVTVQIDNTLEGGQSAVGMVSGQQFLSVSPNAWNRGTLCHEIGHTLGLVHEHQRSDRDNFVTILTNNIVSGGLGNFVILTNSINEGAYDFLSIMHYARNYLSTDTSLDTIEPKPAYVQYINVMGEPGDVTLSAIDRAGMAAVYGAVATNSPVVTNTADSGPGTLRAALYYAYDHPGTRVTFNLATNVPGYTNGVFTIQPTDQLPNLVHSTTLDGASQPAHAAHPNGPRIQINGALCPVPGTIANGLRFNGSNCVARSLVINGFYGVGVLMEGSNVTGNTIAGCYLGIDPSGSVAVTNGFCPMLIDGGAHDNFVGGIGASNRNILSGSTYQGLVIRDPGTQGNIVQGNYIGLDASGTFALSNLYAGLDIYNGATKNLIGGTLPGAGNVVSGNAKQGIVINDPGSDDNVVQGNLVGLNATGTSAVPNAWYGINIFGGAHSNLIGGVGGRNYIAGNAGYGVLITGAGTAYNLVQGNSIGLNPVSFGVPNGFAGVSIFDGAVSNIIGGLTPGAANLIASNNSDGIQLFDAVTVGNSFRGNSIFGNAGNTTGVYGGSNHSDSEGAPTLLSAAVTTNTTITGTLSSLSNATLHLDFYSSPPPSFPPVAKTYLGSRDVITPANGTNNFSVTFAAAVPAGQIITAMTTDANGNTGTLSYGIEVTGTDSIGDGVTDAWRQAHFGGNGQTTNSSSCATCDPDNDGLNNRQEFLVGTDPNDAASSVRLNTVSFTGSNANISFQSVTGVTYRVEYKDSLATNGWTILADQILGTGGVIQLSDLEAGVLPNRFFRLDVLP